MARRNKAKPPVEEAPKPEEAEENLEQGAEGEGENTEGEGDENDPETDGDESDAADEGEEEPKDEEDDAEEDPVEEPTPPAIRPKEAKVHEGHLKKGDQVPVMVMHLMTTQGMSLAEAMKVHNARVEQGE